MARKKVKFEVNPLLSGPSLSGRQRMGSPYRELLITDIDIDPDQPRRNFDTEPLAELASSISEYGVLCPVRVRITEGGTYRLISGERRLRAASLVGLETIPAVIDSAEDENSSILGKQLVENLQRQDLSSMERAFAIGQLRDTHRWSIRDISKHLGLSKSAVQRSLEVLGLPDDLQAALIAGASESKVLLLAPLKSRETRKALLAQLSELTREQLEAEISSVQLGDTEQSSGLSHGGTRKKAKRGQGTLSADDQRLVTELQRSLGTKVELLRRKSKKGQGKLSIDFFSDDDLQDLYQKLTEH